MNDKRAEISIEKDKALKDFREHRDLGKLYDAGHADALVGFQQGFDAAMKQAEERIASAERMEENAMLVAAEAYKHIALALDRLKPAYALAMQNQRTKARKGHPQVPCVSCGNTGCEECNGTGMIDEVPPALP
jgi:hypothetical protein